MTNISAPCGTWISDISADMVAGKSIKLAEPSLNQGRLFWLESVPEEKSRTAIMMQADGQIQCILPNPLSAKSKVHEYGGGSYLIDNDWVYFVLADDQQIYRANFNQKVFTPEALTHNTTLRFADLCLDKKHQRLIAVCEDHSPTKTEPTNYLVSIATTPDSALKIIHQGSDFYAYPRVNHGQTKLCWISWNHPNMPWDNSELWLSDIDHEHTLTQTSKVMGDGEESIFQPRWSPDDQLYAVSDRNNWYNLYRLNCGAWQTVTQIKGEFATPLWTFNMSTYAFVSPESILATYTQNGLWHLTLIDTRTLTSTPVKTHSTDIHGLTAETNTAAFIGASATLQADIFRFDSMDNRLTPVLDIPPIVDQKQISIPTPLSFASSDSGTAHGFYYPPQNSHYTNTSPPPLIVICHGGPTGATSTGFNLKIQYWTQRGFAVLDVNYRGSTGFGRQYRQQLHGKWGIYDVDDVCAAAEYAIERGLAKKGHTIIKGSSAGGYTVLAALAFKNTFDCGVSLYGIGDLETLANDTHKFEARYLDSLIGPYPKDKKTYVARSPIHAVDKMNCPILIFQGLEDKVVPPAQAEAIVSATEKNNLPVAYVTFADEGHGFRQATNIITMLDCELAFYCRIFGLPQKTPQTIELPIRNADKI